MKLPAVSAALLMALSLTGAAATPQEDPNGSVEKRDPPNGAPPGGPPGGFNSGSAPSWWGDKPRPTNGGPNSWGNGGGGPPGGGPGGEGGWGKGGGPPGGGDHQWTGRPTGTDAPWGGKPTGKPSKRDAEPTDTDGEDDGDGFELPTDLEPTGDPLKVNIPKGVVSDAHGNPMICGCWHLKDGVNATSVRNATNSPPSGPENPGETNAPGEKVKRMFIFRWDESQVGGHWGKYLEFGSGDPDDPLFDFKRYGAISRFGWKQKRDSTAGG
ncbi:hypothetical protein B0A52_07952 [Exophiala mesophila]|uniref:Uncharacterized protein n=1 Tax=Exophiala mesophila TaxID=212818 RepID=A0A438MXV3_EXOME|nr:hypothetical protein B0A52_07952 [Exophiala mesophila]